VIKQINHIGISTGNLDRSINFYRDLLGLELAVDEPFGNNRLDTITNLKNAEGRVAVLKLGDVDLEIFEFSNPVAKTADSDRPVCDHGITHICFEVTDIENEYDRLLAAGVGFHCEPQDAGSVKAVYGRDPDGNVFELLEIVRKK
jgi:catechol 2,3-dioxygenase-like lactoylglutathione lyase family enzyme